MATYDYMTSLKNSGRKVQVESAKRDGDGKNIANNYAKQVGYYEGMGVGTADNLTPYSENSGIAQHEPFIFQSTAGGSDVGALCQLKALRGQSYVLNQLVSIFQSSTTYSGVVVTASNDGKKIELSGSAISYFVITKEFGKTIPIGHKLLVKGVYSNSSSLDNSLLGFRIRNADNLDIVKSFVDTNNFNYIYTTTIAVDRFQLYGPNSGDFTGISFENVQVFDLTEMFGAGKEPTTVEEFNRLFPLSYYAYNKGELVSSQSSKLITVGYNQFDGQWTKTLNNSKYEFTNYVRVIPGQEYVAETPDMDYDAMYFHCYDAELNFIENASLTIIDSKKRRGTIPNNAHYVKVEIYKESGINEGQFAFHLRWDDSKTGYESYSKHEYGLPNEVLRSNPATGKYDILKSDGSLIRNVGIRQYTAGDESEPTVTTDLTNTIYDLITPTESDSIAFQENIAIDDWGTMEFVSTYPQGNDFFYYVDYKAFIDSLGNREDIGFDASEIVSQEELTSAMSGIDLSDYVKKTDLSIAYSDYQALTTEQRQALLDKGIQIIGTVSVNTGGGDVINPVLFPRRNYTSYSQGIFIAGSSDKNPTVGTYEQLHAGTTLTIKVLFRCNDQHTTFVGNVRPNANNSQDFGSSSYKWKNIYLAGVLSDGTNSVSIADLAALITYAKTQGWIQ